MTSEPILVTGAAGFAGSELVHQLHAAGHRVLALDNLAASGSWENLAGLDNIEPITGDLRDRGLLDGLMRRVSIVYHLACVNLRHSLEHPVETHDVNATGTVYALDAARAAGLGRFIHVSSSEVYGTALSVPMTEDHPTRPTTPYGASKLAGEAYARAWFQTYALPVVILRPFNMYGPRCHVHGSSSEVIPRFLKQARPGGVLRIFGDGEQTRDFTYVSDTVRGIIAASNSPDAIGGTFNLGSGTEITIKELARRVAPGTDAIHLEGRPGDVRRLVACSKRAREVFGFDPKTNFDEGLASLRDWHRARLEKEALQCS